MSLFSLQFVLYAMAFVFAFRLCPSDRARSAVALIFNAIFVLSYIPSVTAGLPLLGFLALGYVAVKIMERSNSRALLWLWVFALILLFAWLRRYSLIAFLPTLPGVFVTIGLSYILFRILHLLFDARENALGERIGPVDYLNYTSNFLAFVSGPIDRYQSFIANFRAPDPIAAAGARAALGRLVLGYGRVLIVSTAALYVFDNVAPRLLGSGDVAFATAVVLYCAAAASYTLYLYMNFAGYMDIVIGIGTLAGLRIPENFDKPFLTRSQIEFWGRWHITLGEWFKQYAFYPLLQALMMRWNSAAMAPVLGVLTYFLVFLVIGVWHGSTAIFVFYGLVLGLGVSLNKLWQVALAARLGNKGYRQLSKRPVYSYLARGVNIGYFMMALTAFWVSFDQLEVIHERLGGLGWLLAFFALVVFWIGCSLALDLWIRLGERRLSWPAIIAAPARVSIVAMSLVILVSFAVQTILNAEPEFVYAAF